MSQGMDVQKEKAPASSGDVMNSHAQNPTAKWSFHAEQGNHAD